MTAFRILIARMVLLLNGLPLKKAMKDILELNQSFKSPEEKNVWLNNRKWDIYNFHTKNNPLYRKKNSSDQTENWEDLPIMRKQDFQKPIEEMLSEGIQKSNVHVGNTSGSSGHPFFYAKDKYAHARTYANIYRSYDEHGLSLGMKQARFYGIPLRGKQRKIEQLKDFLFNRHRFPVHDLSPAQLEIFLKKFKRKPFAFVYGYTSSILAFAKYLESKNVILKDLCPSLKACIVTSEMCTEEDKSTIEKALGVEVLNEYGASEMDVIAMTDKRGEWRISNENIYLEILDDNDKVLEPGNEGRIVITSLFNKAMPFIRYDIGDYGKLKRENPGILEELTGRTSDIIHLPSGKKAGGLTFYYISRKILESGSAIREFVVKQKAIDTFVFEVVADRQLNHEETLQINKMLDDYLEKGLKLEIEYLDKIERSPNGKIKHFYSEI
ncbi:phenylacetate--CoA ligase family protein [Hyphobacterium sp. CCMP332]|nr:phenylacetate--CoA ligase family protein [Hyphobacterium sp. CCMP332]